MPPITPAAPSDSQYFLRRGDIGRRVFEHQSRVSGFTAKYGCTMLVWCEVHDSRESAVIRERRIKEWRRVWKMRLIETVNPEWKDLALEFIG